MQVSVNFLNLWKLKWAWKTFCPNKANINITVVSQHRFVFLCQVISMMYTLRFVLWGTLRIPLSRNPLCCAQVVQHFTHLSPHTVYTGKSFALLGTHFSQPLLPKCWTSLCLSYNTESLAQKSTVFFMPFSRVGVFSVPNRTSPSPVSRSRENWGRRVRNCWGKRLEMTVSRVCLLHVTGLSQPSTPRSCHFLCKMELVDIPSWSVRRLHYSTGAVDNWWLLGSGNPFSSVIYLLVSGVCFRNTALRHTHTYKSLSVSKEP